MNELNERLIVGALGVILIIAANFISKLSFLILLLAIFIAASIELIKMLGLKDIGKILFVITSAITVYILTFVLNKGFLSGLKILIPLYMWFLAIILIIFFSTKESEFLSPLYAIYLWIPFVFAYFLRSDYGALQTLILFATMWSLDSFSYLFGKKFGKHKVAPLISPNKTWEGTISGIVIAFFVFMILSIIFSGFSYKLIIIAIILPLYGFFGDLFESFLKRRRGLKDSGSILKAHGGILDRFDSFIFAAIAYYPFLSI
jgi:phosphatidate cytidylyltransferase